LDLKISKVLVDSGRGDNRISLLVEKEQAEVKRTYLLKQFGKANHYVNELSALMRLSQESSEDIVKAICLWRDPSDRQRPGIVLEYLQGWESSMDYAKRIEVTNDDIRAIGSRLWDALSRMHNSGLLHADLKPDNVMVDPRTGALKIIDFGFSVPFHRVQHGGRGNPRYSGPEIAGLVQGPINEAADLWSYALTVAGWFICKDGKNPCSPIRIDHNGDYKFVDPSRLATLPEDVRQILHALTTQDPLKRKAIGKSIQPFLTF